MPFNNFFSLPEESPFIVRVCQLVFRIAIIQPDMQGDLVSDSANVSDCISIALS